MRYNDFKNKVQGLPIIFTRDLTTPGEDKQILRNQLERWRRKKLLIKLRRGIFLLNTGDRKINPSRAYIANQLYTPSYVSLEFALNYYNLIPERVSDVTSITTKKTARVKTETGDFTYQHIKPQAFRGFRSERDEAGFTFFIAEPEKALVDFFYLNLEKFRTDYESIFRDFYRFENVGDLNTTKIAGFAKFFTNDKLKRVCDAAGLFIQKERKKK